MPGVNWERDLVKLCDQCFGADPQSVINALWRNPNARGSILGSLAEIQLAGLLTSKGYQVKRIKEKWVGEKVHHGDLYVSRDGKSWFIIESKGLKSNAERWMKLANVDSSRAGMLKRFGRKSSGTLKTWWQELDEKRRERILASGSFHRGIVLQTHNVSGTAGRANREIATPRADEFHVLSVNLFIKTGKHEFVFALSDELERAKKYPEHIQQNYLIDILVPGVDTQPSIQAPWTRDFDSLFARIARPVDVRDMQPDERGPGAREGEAQEQPTDGDQATD